MKQTNNIKIVQKNTETYEKIRDHVKISDFVYNNKNIN